MRSDRPSPLLPSTTGPSQRRRETFPAASAGVVVPRRGFQRARCGFLHEGGTPRKSLDPLDVIVPVATVAQTEKPWWTRQASSQPRRRCPVPSVVVCGEVCVGGGAYGAAGSYRLSQVVVPCQGRRSSRIGTSSSAAARWLLLPASSCVFFQSLQPGSWFDRSEVVGICPTAHRQAGAPTDRQDSALHCRRPRRRLHDGSHASG